MCVLGTRTTYYFFAEQNGVHFYMLTVILFVAMVFVAVNLLRSYLLRWSHFTLGSAVTEDSSLNQPLLDGEEEYLPPNYSDVLRSTHEEKSGSHPWVSVRSTSYPWVYYNHPIMIHL